MLALAAAVGPTSSPSTIPIEVWAFTIVTLTAGIVTAAKGRYGWLLLGVFLVGLPWLVAAFMLARPGSAWATTLYDEDKLSRAQRRAARSRPKARA